MNKTLKIILVNFLFLIFLSIGFEVFFYVRDTDYFGKKYGVKHSLKDIHYSFKKEKFENKFNTDFKRDMRKPAGLQNKKKPVLFLGCSYAYGQFLKDEETISYKISEKAKRPVYNMAYPAWGIQHAYYIMQNTPKIEPEPEYVFYIFMNDHLRRMFVNCYREDYAENLQYKMKDGKPVKIDNRYNIFDNSYFLVNIKNFLVYFYKKSEYSQNLFLDYVYNLNNEVKRIYPNSKFVVLMIDKNDKKKKWKLPYKLMEKLGENGIKTVVINEITDINFSDNKYRLPKEKDFFRHPNGLAWDVVSDALIKEFDL